MARWQTLSAESRETFWRSLQTMNATRVVIALVLLIYLSFDNRGIRATGQYVYGETCFVYLLAGIGLAMLTVYWRQRFLLQLSLQVAVDLFMISALYLASDGNRTALAILYLFPLAGAAILAPLLLALFSASLSTLFLLAESTYQVFMQENEVPLAQAGLYGAAFFGVVVVVNRLAERLIGQEELAVKRGIDLDVQMAINRLVLADMGDGILVLDAAGQVVARNPAAGKMLGAGLDEGRRLADEATFEPMEDAFNQWRRDPRQNSAFVVLRPPQEALVHLKLRFARVEAAPPAPERAVLFMQDVTAIENQAQQLKLASMGRLTASIAHEVRNPLAAIGHAAALLAEDLHQPTHARLLKIVSDNVARVNRMVEDILRLSRKVQPNAEPLDLNAFLAELKAEFDETHDLAEDLLWLGDAGPEPVRFDALHLREVVVNLLTNALRYASGKPGCIRIFVVSEGQRRELHVQDDGPGITADVRMHLFEPFYTTSSKGTGLGLYLARELCLNNGAALDYEYRYDAGPEDPAGRFVITFAQARASDEEGSV
ncbi:PAS domain-containing sensor histidine kinase [Massilia sp. TS11]|uniref:sensor histidine kinase n=1 Tax=Massilia sp. TS11 TaxID=2908003 RepID=UPI001EDBAE0B|nr:ATP-binding protein [Massilia sp. TS11]MCG2583417.1 ATP-binding protein [Massilia sp. TS11]